MSRQSLILLAVALLAGGAPQAASADTYPLADVRIVPHVVPGAPAPAGCTLAVAGPCGSGSTPYNVRGALGTGDVPYSTVYVIVDKIPTGYGFTGIQFGVDYDGAPGSGVDVIDWTACGIGEFRSDTWPDSGSGITLTWLPDPECDQHGPRVVAGYFTVAAAGPDVFDLTARPVDRALKVSDCSMRETILDPLAAGAAGFGDAAGHDPCAEDPPPAPPAPPPPSPPEPVKLMLHAVRAVPFEGNACSALDDIPCQAGAHTFTTGIPGGSYAGDYDVYVIATDFDQEMGLGQIRFQVRLEATAGRLILESWNSCAPSSTTESPWSSTGGNLTVTWMGSNCAHGPSAVAGYMRLSGTGAGVIKLAGKLSSKSALSTASMLTCGARNLSVPYLDVAQMGIRGNNQFDPCYESGTQVGTRKVPVERTTWGRVKAMYD